MAKIPLRRRDGSVKAWTTVDDNDAELLNEWRWCLTSNGYAYRKSHGRSVRMHRFIMGLDTGDTRQVDHFNGDRLDNRRSNLRVVEGWQNQQNLPSMGGASRHRGVSWDKRSGKWLARAVLKGKAYHLGLFSDEEEAARVVTAWRAKNMPYSRDA